MKYSSKDVVEQESSATSSAVAAKVLDEFVRNYWDNNDRIDKATSQMMERSDFSFTAHSVDRCRTEAAYFSGCTPPAASTGPSLYRMYKIEMVEQMMYVLR